MVLPVWNAERYLARAIESVLAQTFADFELLIVDDGSSDASGAVIRSFRDARVRGIANPENLGVTRSLNLGLAQARGRYVARMDADDLCAPERLERQVAYLDAHPHVALVATHARLIDGRGVELGVAATPVDGETLRRRLRVSNCIVHGSVMARADVVRALGGYDESMDRAQDYDLWLRIAERHPIAALPDLLYAWRHHDEGVGRIHSHEQVRLAERARLAARRRWVAALVDEVVAGSVSIERAARRALELRREEERLAPSANRLNALVAACARRVPRLDAHCYPLWNFRALARIRRVLAACCQRRHDPDAVGAAISAVIAELDSTRPRASAAPALPAGASPRPS